MSYTKKWNHPCANGDSAQSRRGARTRGIVPLVAILTVAMLLVVFFVVWCRNGGDVSHDTAKGSRRIESRPPRKANSRSLAGSGTSLPSSEKVAEPLKKPSIPVGNVTTALTNQGRIETLLDGTIVTSRVQVVFKRPFERGLQVALRPGGFGASSIMSLQKRYSEEQILSMLREITRPEPEDDEKVAALKNRVQRLKEDILMRIREGHTVKEVFDELRRQCAGELSLRNGADRIVREASCTGDARLVEEAVKKTNKLLGEHGLSARKAPHKFRKELEEIKAAERAYEEGSRQADEKEFNNAIKDSFN